MTHLNDAQNADDAQLRAACVAKLGEVASFQRMGAASDAIGVGRWVSLSRAIEDPDFDATAAARQLLTLFEEWSGIPVQHWGPSPVPGPLPDWTEYLLRRTAAMRARFEPRQLGASAVEALTVALAALDDVFSCAREGWATRQPRAVPVGLDPAQLVWDGRRIGLIDVPTLWGADPLLALGAFAWQVFGTRLHTALLRAASVTDDVTIRWVRAYGLWQHLERLEPRLGVDPAADEVAATLAHSHALALREAGGASPERLAIEHGWAEPWGLKIDPVHSERTLRAAQLLPPLRAEMEAAGVTRLADITGLDVSGLPVWQAVRPDAERDPRTFTVFSGRGLTPEDSQVGAIAEAIERRCAERESARPGAVLVESYQTLQQRGAVIAPAEFHPSLETSWSEHEPIEWVRAERLGGGHCFVPANAVYCPYRPQRGRALFPFFNTGLAAGTNLPEALAHGLAEVIERDAAALNLILRRSPVVRLDTVCNPRLKHAIERLRDAHLNVIIRWISAPDIAVPVFSALIEDPDARDPLFVSGGYGAHPNKDLALLNAVLEASASRTGTISGAREDIARFEAKRKLGYDEFKARYRYWFDTTRSVDHAALPSRTYPTALEDLAWMWQSASAAGLQQVCFVELSPPGALLKVVKVLVPGVERYSFASRPPGARARRFYQQRFGRQLPAHPGDRRN